MSDIKQSNVDVLVIVGLRNVLCFFSWQLNFQGAGPAGVIAADWLARFTKYGVTARVIDKRSHKVFTGQADGLNPRSLEMFQSFNLMGKIGSEGQFLSHWSLNSAKMLFQQTQWTKYLFGLQMRTTVVSSVQDVSQILSQVFQDMYNPSSIRYADF